MKSKASPGDYVKISLSKKEYEGILLESSESGVIMVKLSSGYNIGFNKKDVENMEVLKKFSPNDDDFELKKDSKKPSIGLIITGGTIAARLNSKKGGVDWLDTPESLFRYYPGIFDIANVSKVEIPFMKASEDMDYKDWQKIARSVKKLIEDPNIKGIVITHGTDTLHYTSAALSFFIQDLNKPVILTYSQRSIDRASSDANLNLRCAVFSACSDLAGIFLVGHSSSNDDFCYLFPGTKVRKIHSSRRDAFKPINSNSIAKIYSDKIEFLSEHKKRNKNKPIIDLSFEANVALVKFYPGQDPDILDYYLKKKYRGLILEMSGLGHVATMRSRNGWTKKLKEVQEKGMIVCGVSQCIFGRVDPLVYSNGRELLQTGIIYLEDMTAETALVKLGWVLGHEKWQGKEIVRQKMLHNFSGEISERLSFNKNFI